MAPPTNATADNASVHRTAAMMTQASMALKEWIMAILPSSTDRIVENQTLDEAEQAGKRQRQEQVDACHHQINLEGGECLLLNIVGCRRQVRRGNHRDDTGAEHEIDELAG